MNHLPQEKSSLSPRIVISVLGADRPGIVAQIALCLSEHQANIVDISQTILDGIFTMTMIVDLSGHESFSELKAALNAVEDKLQVQINLQREDIFKSMYRI